MIERSIKGNIVNICSEMGFRPAANAYGISKWGVRAMTEGIATNLAKYGIVVNGVAPGETATEILRQAENEIQEIDSPRGIQATPDEIAEAVYFMANSKNIIGEILVSDGGRRLK
jgi:3-oxoacyl-[acyl-carrier protein] reductase